MALLTKSGSFTRPAAGTTNSVVSGLGFSPRFLLLLPSSVLTANAWRAEAGVGIMARARVGTTDANRGAGVLLAANDANASPRFDTEVLNIPGLRDFSDTTLTTAFAATSIALDADGFTIDYADTPYDGEQEHIAYLAAGGDADSIASAVAIPAGIAVGDVVTAPLALPFLPAAVLVAADKLLAAQTASSFGVRDSYAAEWAVSTAGEFTADPSNVWRRMSSDRCVHLIDGASGAVRDAFTITHLGQDRVDFKALAVSADPPAFLRFVVLGGCTVNAGTFARSTAAAPANQTVTVKGNPKAALFAGVHHTANDSTQAHSRGFFGVSDGTNHRAVAWQVEDNAGTSNSDTYFANDKALLVANNATPTVEGAATATFATGQINLVWNPNDAAPIGLPSTYGPVATAVMRRTPALRRRPIDAAALVGLGAMRRLGAFHEAGHAVVAFALGWDQNLLKLSLRTNADESAFFLGARRITDLARIPERTATSLSGAPPMPDDPDARRAWARIGGAIAWGGAVAEDTVRAACGFPLLKQPAVEYSAGDWDNWTRYRDASPEPIADYALATRKMAKAAVAGHHRQLENLANALLERGDLSIAECLTIWHRGALPARGVVGRLRFMPSRAAAAGYGCPIPEAVQLLAAV